MRIFEKISRRLSITLAGVMACSSFAMAPAITAYASTQDDNTIKEMQEAAKAELKNDDDFAAETKIEARNNVVYKIKSDIDGKLRVFVKAKDAAKVDVVAWKENEKDHIIEDTNKDIEAGKTYDTRHVLYFYI